MSDDNSFNSKDQKIPEETENLIKEAEKILHSSEKQDLSDYKETTGELARISKEETLHLTKLVQQKEIEIKSLNNDKILLERNNIQLDIQKNQELIIDEYKDNNKELKLNLDQLQTKVEELNNSNRKFLINNDELKKTISRFIKHNKNLQSSLNELKEIQSEYTESKLKINKMTEQISFYQDDNSRLSNEIINIQKKYETIKNNFNAAENEKNDIFKQIQDLNNSLTKTNIVGTPFIKDTVEEKSINQKILNDTASINLKKEKIKSEEDKNLDEVINDIFK